MEDGHIVAMDAQLGLQTECLSQMVGPETVFGSVDPTRFQVCGSDGGDRCYVPRTRPSEANGFVVYTRNKKLKSLRMGRVGEFDKPRNNFGVPSGVDEAAIAIGEAVCGDVIEGIIDDVGCRDGEMVEVEVKEEPMAAEMRSKWLGRFTPSGIHLKEDGVEGESFDELQDVIPLEVEGLECDELTALASPTANDMEMEMSGTIAFRGRPTTVKELFETGLLWGYPVFYNGGKRGFPLRGVIKDTGILCSCSLCKGVRVVPPCQFEIHACKAYRRASQYICLENGKSLLDVVKECRKSSVKTLEETIQNFIGPMPVKESVICNKCQGTFLATPFTKIELLCDSCMIFENLEIDVDHVKSRPLEPLVSLTMPESVEAHCTPENKGLRGRKKKKHLELASKMITPRRSSLQILTRKKGKKKKTKISMEPSSTFKSPESALVSSTAKPPKSVSVKSKNSSRITKKDQKLHRLVFEDSGLPDGTEVAYYSNGKKLRDGYKMGAGIFCHCCSSLVSPSLFEAHAGWASRRKPYMYIYTSNGVSLHEFAISLLKGRKCSAKDNDDLCVICADGGKLVLCDGCPRAFHKECASLLSIPRGKWFCTYCQNMFQRERFTAHNANAVAAGRVLGVDSIEYISNRCVRTVKNPEEAEVIACIICRGYDFSKSGFGPRTVILCDQCEKEYHVGCLKKSKMADLKELPKGNWFCSVNCKKMYFILQNLVIAGAEKVPDSSLCNLKKQAENNLVAGVDLDVRWRLLNGKITSRETRVCLSQAVAIFHDSFDPIVDSETGRDFIPSMVYGRNIRGQDFSGMYCAILTVNSTVVSAGILRIFGQDVAELPLAATRKGNQGKGYFQVLYSCIEKLLAFLKVQSFVLPATDEAKSIWTEKFGFGKIPEAQLLNYKKICWQMMTFKGTSMLQKAVPRCRIINQDEQSHVSM